MWSRTPAKSTKTSELAFGMFDEEMLAQWASTSRTDVHRSELVTPQGDRFVPKLKYRWASEKESQEVDYLSPSQLRLRLEEVIDLKGYGVLQVLFKSMPVLYWNLIWYCSRLGLPIPVEGPVRREATTQWDSHRFSLERVAFDAGLSKTCAAEIVSDLDQMRPMWQNSLRRLVTARDTESDRSQSPPRPLSLYQKSVLLKYGGRLAAVINEDVRSDAYDAESIRKYQDDWSREESDIRQAVVALPPDHLRQCESAVDVPTQSLARVIIRSYFGLLL